MTPDRLRLHPLEELAGQVEADVGLEQDPADLPEALLDRVFRQDTAPSELLEGGVEFLGQLVEHKPVSITGGRVLDKPPEFAGARPGRLDRGQEELEAGLVPGASRSGPLPIGIRWPGGLSLAASHLDREAVRQERVGLVSFELSRTASGRSVARAS